MHRRNKREFSKVPCLDWILALGLVLQISTNNVPNNIVGNSEILTVRI
jgi:hypothetical protein